MAFDGVELPCAAPYPSFLEIFVLHHLLGGNTLTEYAKKVGMCVKKRRKAIDINEKM